MIDFITKRIGALSGRTKTKVRPVQAQWTPIDDPLIDIVVPCYNEAETLRRNIRKLYLHASSQLPWRFTITIADSGSTDDTLAIAENLSHTYPQVHVRREAVKGRGRALRKAWLSSDADVLVYMDEDLSTHLSHLKPLIEPLVAGDAPVATGSRLRSDSQTRRSLKRDLISRGYIWMLHLFLRLNVSDAQCGFKAIRRDAARRILPNVSDEHWFFDTELLFRAEQLGWRVHEVGVRWQEDPDSRVNIIATALEDVKGIVRLRKEADTTRLRDRIAFGGLMLGAALFYVLNLGINGYANSYYAAAVQAASTSWHAFFFASLDGAGWVSVDKPPVAIWVSALSARLFGFSSFSMLLPHALAGIATVALVYMMVRRYFSPNAGLLAGAVMALTPAAALMFRFNNPDSILTLLLTAGTYTFMRAIGSSKVRWLVGTGLIIGTAFNTKMIQALIILPVLVLVYLFAAKPKIFTRIWHLLVASAALAVSALWWPVIVALTPAADRPYIGSTSDNSIWSLIFGYNGLSRFLGNRAGNGGGMGGGGFTGGGGMGGMMGSGFGGSTGVLRMFNDSFGPNIAWLIPLALLAAIAVLWWTQREKRTNHKRALILVALGWLLIHAAVFSMTGGTIHPYYVVVMAPAVAILVGAGLPYLKACYVSGRWPMILLPVAVLLSAVTAFVLFSYDTTWMTYLRWPALIGGLIAAILLTLNLLKPRLALQTSALVLAAISVGFGPVSYAFATVSVAHTGSIPTAGLESTAMAGSNNESASVSSELTNYLLAGQGDATWVAVTDSANTSAGLQISTGQPVMALGGFNGSDDTTTLAAFKALVKAGKVKYYVAGQGGMGGGFGGGGPGGASTISEITSWIEANAKTVTTGGSDNVTVYDLTTIDL